MTIVCLRRIRPCLRVVGCHCGIRTNPNTNQPTHPTEAVVAHPLAGDRGAREGVGCQADLGESCRLQGHLEVQAVCASACVGFMLRRLLHEIGVCVSHLGVTGGFCCHQRKVSARMRGLCNILTVLACGSSSRNNQRPIIPPHSPTLVTTCTTRTARRSW